MVERLNLLRQDLNPHPPEPMGYQPGALPIALQSHILCLYNVSILPLKLIPNPKKNIINLVTTPVYFGHPFNSNNTYIYLPYTYPKSLSTFDNSYN